MQTVIITTLIGLLPNSAISNLELNHSLKIFSIYQAIYDDKDPNPDNLLLPLQ